MKSLEYGNLQKHFRSFIKINMSKELIEKIESKPWFHLFIRRVGCKNFAEYMELFGDDMEKRQTACEWFIETYPNQAKN